MTISKGLTSRLLEFKIPNYVMENLYYDYFLSLLEKKKVRVDNQELYQAVDSLKQDGKIKSLVSYVEKLIKLEGKRTLIKYD